MAAELYPIMQGFLKTQGEFPAGAFRGADGVNGAEGLNKSPDPKPNFGSSVPDPVPVVAGMHLFESGASLVAKAAPVAKTFILFPVFIVTNFKLLLSSCPSR